MPRICSTFESPGTSSLSLKAVSFEQIQDVVNALTQEILKPTECLMHSIKPQVEPPSLVEGVPTEINSHIKLLTLKQDLQ